MSPIGVPLGGQQEVSGPVLDPAAAAWHDVTCPEGPQCRNRHVHARSAQVVTTGVLERFLTRYEGLRGQASSGR